MKLNLRLLPVIIACSTLSVSAQILPWPTDPYGDKYRVDSAYGPRDVKGATFFHKGMDLNGKDSFEDTDINYPLTAAGFGAVFGIGNAGVKWIGIDYSGGRTFAYLHIFPDNEKESKGNFVGVGGSAPIRSYKRFYTDYKMYANHGVILFYSGLNQTGRIVKALGISGIHNTTIEIPNNGDGQPVPLYAEAPTEDTVIVSPGANGVLETTRQGDDVIVNNTIVAGPNKIAESEAGKIIPQTSVALGDIIAPLGKSGTDNAHLHLQISSPDPNLHNGKVDGNPLYNDGWNNVVQHLARGQSEFSGDISAPAENSVIYHTEDHNNERIKAQIRLRPEGTDSEVIDWKTYHPYELDRLRIMAIPIAVLPNLTPEAAVGNTYLINGSRNVQVTFPNQLPDLADPFRAEFDYGGSVGGSIFEEDNAFPPFINNTSSNYRSDGTRTGLNPLGSLSSMPVTEFIFNQWNTRIHKDFAGEMPPKLANRNEDAAYPDGQYGLVAIAESVDREESERFISDPTMITINNFRPYVKQVEVKQGSETVYKRSWALKWDLDAKKDFLRSYAPSVDEPLFPGGHYTVLVTYSEPMGWASLGGGADPFTPYSTVLSAGLTIGSFDKDALQNLEIAGSDMIDQAVRLLAIAPDKTYIDPALELTRDADGEMQGIAGTDKFHSLHVEAGSPPEIEYEDKNNLLGHRCGGTCGTEAEPAFIVHDLVRFRYTDAGSGVKNVTIRNIAGEIPDQVFNYKPYVYAQELSLNLPDGLYVQTVTDNYGHDTVMWFRVDPESPLLKISLVNMNLGSGDYTVHGTVQDANSGLDFLHLSYGGGVVTDFGVTPGRKDLVPFGTPALTVGSVGEPYYVFSAQDQAGNGSFPQPIFAFARVAGLEGNVASYLTKVRISGDPCDIVIKSSRSVSAIPIETGLPPETVYHTVLDHQTTEVIKTPNVYLQGGVLTVKITPTNACSVVLEGESITGLANGPAEAFVRNSPSPIGGVRFRFEWSEITFYNLITDGAGTLTMENVVAPAPPENFVVEPLGLNRSLNLTYPGASYSGGVKIKTCGFPGNAGDMRMWHYSDSGEGNDITSLAESDCITGFSQSASRFSVVAPISKYDQAGPEVYFKTDNTFTEGGSVYMSSSSQVALSAKDRSSNILALAGVASTYYLLDTEPTPECLGTAYEPAAAPGTCPNPLYGGPFKLGEGAHSVYFYAVDKIGNLGEGRSSQLRVDSTPPESSLELNDQPIGSGATVYATTTDLITLVSTDAVSNGVNSGLTTTYFLVDVSPEDCDYSEWAEGGINGMGSCENSFYAGPFTLPPGDHTVYHMSVDNVGNREAGKSVFIEVLPPVTLTSVTLSPSFVFLEIGGTQQFGAMGMFSDGTSRALTASDGPRWSVVHDTVAAITTGGLVTGAAYGKTQVGVSFGNLSAEAFLFVYEPLPPSFTATGSMTVPRHTHTATLLPDGNVLVAGGNNGAQILSSAEVYYPNTGKFIATGSMRATRGRGHTETLLPDGTVLLTGGISGNYVVATAEVYNPTTQTFSQAGSMAAARYSHSATLLADGKVLITGGAGDNGTVSLAELYDPAAGTFSAAGSLTLARYYHTATLLPSGKVLVAGGLASPGSGHTSTAEIYDPITKIFSPTGPLSTKRAYAKAVLLWTGEVLLIGGYSGISNVLAAETYNPASGSFSTAGSLSVGRMVGHTATLMPDGRVLVAGGDVYGNNNPISVAEIYDPVTRKFGATVSMSSSRFFHAAALLLPNGRVLVCGGNNSVSSLTTAELYNLGFGVPSTLESITVIPSSATIEVGGTKQFTATGNFSDGSSRPLGAGLDWSVVPGTVAAIGSDGLATGVGLGKARITVSSGSLSAEAVLVVSPPEPKFIATGSMTVPRHTHTATLLPDGNVLVAGGNNGAQILASAEVYYPGTGKFIATGSMRATRGRGHTETLLPGGKVLLTGGISGNSVVATAEVYNPTTGEFLATGSMAEARYSHNATLLANGKVLITGGAGDNGTVSQAELYDPAAGTFSAAGSLALARYYHTATLLPDGKVLVAGGLAAPGSGHTATAEIYDPVKKTFSPTGPLSAKRAYAKAVLLRTGEVLVIGGYSGTSNVLAAETYNPGSGNFSVAGSLGVGRMVGHTATLLPDGKVLVAGGDVYGNNNPISVAEIYDPVTRAFGTTVPMSTSRFFHAAALLLPNGKVLVCGGNNASTSLTTAELFDSGFRGTLSPMLTSLLVEPSTASLAAGSAQQFTAFGNFSDGSSRVLSAADGLDWSVGHDTVAFISEGGLVTGIAYGKTSVKASSGIYSSEAGLSIFYPPGVSADGLVSVNAPDAGLSVTAVSTDTITSTAPIFAAMSVAGLKPAMDAFYDFQPSGVQFAAPAKLRFIFDPALVEPAAVAIYYFDGVAWSSASIADQSTGLLAGGLAYVEGYISHSSIYAALYFKDILPPVTGLAFSGPNFGAKPVYISSFTTLSLVAYDDAVTAGDRLGGVAARYYSVDSGVFTLYSGTFSIIGEGNHVVGYYSVDTAGNREEPRSAAVSVDVTPAVSTVSLDGTAGQKGWFVSPVAVALTSTDSLSGVAAAYYAQSDAPFALYGSSFGVAAEGVHSLRHYAIDNIGNREAEKAISFGIDTSTPIITFARTPGNNAAGWSNTPVSVVFSGTDAVSGIAYCSPTLILETEGSGQLVSGYCADYAGWSSTTTLTLNIDRTAPGLTISSPAAGNVFIATKDMIGMFFTAADNLDPAPKASARLMQMEDKGSPRGDRPAVIAVTYGQLIEPLDIDDGIWRLAMSATDFADNTSTLSGGTFEVVHDVLAPRTGQAIAGGASLTDGATTYLTGGTVLKFSSADDLVLAEDGIGLGIKKQIVRLKAEGLIVKEFVFENPEPKQGAVFNSTFTLAATSSLADGLYSLSYYAEDILGNIEGEKTFILGLDNAAPVTAAELTGTPGENGWHVSAVSVKLTASDALSDVAGIYYQSEFNGQKSELKSYTEPFTISAEGLYNVYFYAKDRLGNTEAEKTIAFKIDSTNPLISAERTPLVNAHGWNNTPVTTVFRGTDAISGVSYCSPAVVLEIEGFGQPVSGYCADYAGWSSTATLTLNIDRTAPALTISSPAAGNIFIATKDKIGVFFTAADNLDSAPRASARLTQVEDKGSPRGGRPAVIAVTYGQLIEPLDIDDGIWRLVASATDFADNTSTLSGGTFEVVHDVLAPRTWQAVAGGASLTDGVTTYVTSETGMKFSSADDLVVAEDGIGLGVKKQAIKLKAAGLVVKEIAFENPEPKQGAVFNSTFTLAATSGLADGLYSLSYYAEDILGNIEAEKTFILGLDNASPVTTAELTGTSGESGWYISAVSVKLTANDALSGVAEIHYQSEFNGQRSELKSYTGPFTLSAEGLYNVYFYAKDRLGNTEAEKAIAFKIDRTDPLISAERTPLANTYGWSNTAVTVNYLCTDGLSGVISCSPAAVLAGEGINQSASGEARDYAGNSSSVTISGINIDKTAPISAYRVEGIVYNGDGKTYLSPISKLSLNAADPISGGAASGIDIVEYHIDSAPFLLYTSSFSLSEGMRSVNYRSRDKAGNEETGRSVELHIDGTSPVTSFNISGTPYIVDGTHYINSQSVISFAVVDPLVDGVASGSLITKYRLDGGAWQVYAASITIPAEGLHKLEYYSLDNVQNAEALRTLAIVVDNTAPAATLSVGEPVFEVFGLKIMTPETPVTLAASDPETAGPASGVKSIYYELTDAAGQGSGVRNYTEPFSTGREGVFTVSYWSADNAGNSGTPLEAKLRVSSLRSDALDAVDGLEMTGSADIAGTVRSNATVSLGGNARILGDVYASTISLSGKAQLTGQQHSGAATLVPTPLYMPEIIEIASNTNNNSLIPAKYLVNGRLVVPAKDELTLSTGIYYFNGIDLGGGARVGVNGKVDILVAGDISINGGAALNAAGSSSRLNIFLSTGSALTFTGGGSLAAYVYAPYSSLKLAGNALLGGHYFVKRAVLSGAGNILQAGEALPVAAASPGGGPKTKAAAMPSGSFGILAGPDPAFRLGEIYVFPNPAKGGEAPVFHVETGLADTVKITIYTISGRAAHEHTLTGMPAELDDGNGLSYAYEYVWRGHIPSGVYLYYIETQKAGQKLKKTGKFSVVR